MNHELAMQWKRGTKEEKQETNAAVMELVMCGVNACTLQVCVCCVCVFSVCMYFFRLVRLFVVWMHAVGVCVCVCVLCACAHVQAHAAVTELVM